VILCDRDIKQALAEGRIRIDPPPDPIQYSTFSLDLLLGDEFHQFLAPDELAAREPPRAVRNLEIDAEAIDIRAFQSQYAKPVPQEPDGSFRLLPRTFTLGRTRERVHLPRASQIAARVEGRSTLARLGLVVHMTAPVIHSNFEGIIVLEMYNFNHYPLILRPNKLRICQHVFEQLSGEAEGERDSRHQGQSSVS
jgi:dCTP deaminase